MEKISPQTPEDSLFEEGLAREHYQRGKKEMNKKIMEASATVEAVCKLVMKLEVELKQRLNQIEKKAEILDGMVKSLWRDSHPLDELEVVKSNGK